MMTQKERMASSLVYDPNAPEIMSEQVGYLDRMNLFNRLLPSQTKEKEQYMKETFAQVGEGCYIELPFYANWGGKNLHMGDRVYANFGLTLVDDAQIYIGNDVLIAPHVTITTATHPIHPGLRGKALQYNRDVHIGNNVWLGASVTVLPGVHIGDNSVIGAGSVVNRDIPANCVAAGVPCRVLREIGERDKTYLYGKEKIDWENILAFCDIDPKEI